MKYKSQAVLERISSLELNIEQLKFELEALEKNRIFIRAVKSDSIPGSAKSGEASFEKACDKLADLTGELDRKITELADARHEAIALIQRLDNNAVEKILFMRYVRRMQFDEISSELGFADSYVYTLHRRGLERLDKLLRDNENRAV